MVGKDFWNHQMWTQFVSIAMLHSPRRQAFPFRGDCATHGLLAIVGLDQRRDHDGNCIAGSPEWLRAVNPPNQVVNPANQVVNPPTRPIIWFDSWMTPRQRATRCSTASRVANASLLCFQDPFGLLCNVRRGAVSSWRESRGTGQYFVVAWLMSWAYSTLGLCWVSKTAHMFSSPIPPKQKHWRPKSNKYCCFSGAWWLEVSTNAEWPLYIYFWNDLSAIARGALCRPFCFLIFFGICTWVSHDSISKA